MAVADAGTASALAALLALMARLRGPEGCPWDRAQSFATIAPYTIEEAYEVADAIAAGDMAAVLDELGDLLFQVVFHARMAEEAGLFDFAAVARAITAKMLARHPHVFADAAVTDAAAQTQAWEAIKAAERAARAAARGQAPSRLDGIPPALPALTRAAKLQKRANAARFDWADARGVLAKIREELDEFEAELPPPGPSPGVPLQPAAQARLADEGGDVLFTVVNLLRHADVDPEAALRGSNAKFERRFRALELALGERLDTATVAEMETAWQAAKAQERRNRGGDSGSSPR